MSTSYHPASPKVFVSSTVKDMLDLRSALGYILTSQGVTVNMSEAAEFAVKGDRSAIEECFENIRACDYYVLIIGSRKGQPYDETVSITRQEYRVAREHFHAVRRPRLLFYLREDTETALKAGEQYAEGAGIDDPAHLRSFIEEVQAPPEPDTPSYLARFGNFEQLIRSLALHLNLGRSLWETLTRHSLVSELTANLRCMVTRSGSSVFPNHWYMTKVREEVKLGDRPDELLGQTTHLASAQVNRLAAALVGRARASQLRTRVMEDAVDRGVFVMVNPATSLLEETPVHRLLQQTLDDVERLSALDSEVALNRDWESNLLRHIQQRPKGAHVGVCVPTVDLLRAFAHYDRVEDLFNEHVALCRLLLQITQQLEPCARRPLTPLGEAEEKGMRAERVSGDELAHLIRNEVQPFGTKFTPETLPMLLSDGGFIQAQSKALRITLSGSGIAGISDDELDNMVSKALERLAAKPEECIDDLRTE